MSLNFYGATGLIGGTDGKLDDIDGAALADGDAALVITATHTYHYILDDDSGAGEASPDIIEPDANGGTKRWLLVAMSDQDTSATGSPTFAGTTITNCAVLGSNSAVFQPAADSTTFFQVLDQDGGVPVLNVDTTNERVGIGTTSPKSQLQVGTTATAATVDSTQGLFGNNIYYDSGWKYVTSAAGSAMRLSATGDGDISFHTTPAGTAGTAATLTTRMTILNTGNVGIGIDTPIEKFHLQKGSNTISFTPNRRTIAIFEGANADGAVVDIVGADTADTVGISMGKALTETIGRVVYDFDNDRLALGVNGDSNFFVLTGGVGTIRAGIHETAPETILEITHTEPYLTLHNSTEEDSDGGRESRIIARGEQSGEEESILGWLEFSHDGAANDQNGQLRVYINDGDDGTSPTLRTKWGYDGSLYHGDGTNQAVIDAAGVITLEGSAKRILTLRPELNNQEIINRTVPEYEVIGAGVVFGYGLPLWNVADGGDLLSHQELHFKENVPGRWDGASDIEFHVRVCLAGAEDVDDKFKFQFSWNQTGETDLVPVVTHDTTDEITVVDGTQYATYDLVFTIDYNIDGGDAIIAHDLLSGRLRRVAASANECDNEIIVLEWHSHYVVDKMFKAP